MELGKKIGSAVVVGRVDVFEVLVLVSGRRVVGGDGVEEDKGAKKCFELGKMVVECCGREVTEG